MFHILCLTETKIHHASTNVHKFINSSKYSYIPIHDDVWHVHMHINSFNTITSDGLEYIITTFNINTQKKKTHCTCM